MKALSAWQSMLLAFAVALGLAALAVFVFGSSEHGLDNALKITARFSFLLFWCAYVCGAFAKLFGAAFMKFARQGRTLGLAFVAAHSVHLGLVVWLYQVAAKPPVGRPQAIFFSIGLSWMYLLALSSIPYLSRLIANWRLLRLIGMEYISFAFLTDFVGHHDTAIAYVPFAVLSVAGTFLRLMAWLGQQAARVNQAAA